MTDDYKKLAAKLREQSEARASGEHTFDVRMHVHGSVVYRVRADSADQAEEKAWELFNDGASPHVDNTECQGLNARLVPPVTLEDLLREPREDP